jgi:site-specific DNA-methyltransferase (adenine-specific)
VARGRIEQIGRATLYLGDCRDILPQLTACAVVTDPPYGIGVCGNEGGVTSLKSGAKDYGKQEWDSTPIGSLEIDLIRKAANDQILWGGNYFASHLPNSQCWLVWDKLNGEGFSLADVELAWTSFDRAARICRISRHRAAALKGRLVR